MNKINLSVIGFVFTVFSLLVFTSCGDDTVAAKSSQPANLSYHEEFDSLQRVIDVGWKGINRSDPIGGGSWQGGNYDGYDDPKFGPTFSGFPAHSYKASANEYAYANFTCGADLSFINCWLLSPPLSMKNGDVISFWTRTNDPVGYPDRLQVWLNPANDGTNVGKTAAETGDFTVKMLDINPTLSLSPYPTGYPTEWRKFELTISGLPNGTIPQKHRVGFRYYVQNGGPGGSNSWEIGIDDFDFISH